MAKQSTDRQPVVWSDVVVCFAVELLCLLSSEIPNMYAL